METLIERGYLRFAVEGRGGHTEVLSMVPLGASALLGRGCRNRAIDSLTSRDPLILRGSSRDKVGMG